MQRLQALVPVLLSLLLMQVKNPQSRYNPVSCPFCHVSLSCILCLYRSLTLSFFPPSCMLCSLAHSLFIYSRHSARVHTCTHTRFLSQTSVCLSESISVSYAVTHRLDAKEAAEGSKQYAVKRSSVELLWNKTESFVKFVA